MHNALQNCMARNEVINSSQQPDEHANLTDQSVESSHYSTAAATLMNSPSLSPVSVS